MSLEQGEVRGAVIVERDDAQEPMLETLVQPTINSSANNIKTEVSFEINPLLKPACDEIKGQLRRLRDRLSNDCREAEATLAASKKERTELGDLLSQLQDTRDRQEQNTIRLECELEAAKNFDSEASKELVLLQQEGEAEAALKALKRAKLESLQLKLGKLTARAHSLEGENNQETSELAATQRAAWCADERAQRQLLQNQQRVVIIQQLCTNIMQMNELSNSDRAAAELHSKQQQVKLAEIRAAEEDVAAVKKEAKLLHNKWENALIKLRKVDAELESAISRREEIEEKISAAKREVAKLREEQGVESERNYKRGHAVIQAVNRSKLAKKRILQAKEDLCRVLEGQKATEAAIAEAITKLQQHEARRKEAEHHKEELLVQKHRVAAASNALEMKLEAMWEVQYEADTSLKATQQELRAAKIAAIEKAAEIDGIENEISKLQEALRAKQGELELLKIDLEVAERDVSGAEVQLEALQQQIDGIVKTVALHTRQLQLLRKRKQERDEAGREDNDISGIFGEIDRIRKELSATEDGKRAAQANWAQAQERLWASSQRHFQLTEVFTDAEKKLSESISTRTSVFNSIKASEMEIQQLGKKLQSLQREISRLDVGLHDMEKLENTVKNDLISQQTKYKATLEGLENACRTQNAKIVAALQQRAQATTDTTAAEIHLQEINEEKRAQIIQIAEKRRLSKGEVQEATILHGEAARLRRKLSAVYKRRNTTAVLLQKAAGASGIDSSDRYNKILKQRNSDTLAKILASKERLEALRLERKNENLNTARKNSLGNSSCGGSDDSTVILRE